MGGQKGRGLKTGSNHRSQDKADSIRLYGFFFLCCGGVVFFSLLLSSSSSSSFRFPPPRSSLLTLCVWPLASWLSPSRQAPPCPEPLPKEYVFVAVVVVVVVRGAKVCQWVRPRPHQEDNTRLSVVVVVTRACVRAWVEISQPTW